MIIFTSLGLGMASPYVLLASNPKWLRFIPKPGAWMETFKQAMGFLLLATTGWLIWVLSNQVETEKIIILLFALLGVSVAGWIWGKWGTIIQKPGTRILALLVAAALLVGSSYKTISSVLESHKENIPAWQQYSPELVEQLRRENKAVFIDFTAKWCLSCQVNKKVALHTEEVEKMFRKKGVVTLEADWTNRDEAVTKALAAFHRNSVPLYVLFPSGENKQPIILPEVLTPGIVISSLEKLDGK
jgi:thiol:disulfide interchange protein DsbD